MKRKLGHECESLHIYIRTTKKMNMQACTEELTVHFILLLDYCIE
jgi:hypothetical protein